MPLDKIYSEPEATRVKRLWNLYRVIFAAVLFTPAPKLSHELAYEWAFGKLSDFSIMALALHPLKVTDERLSTYLPCIILSERLSSNRQSVIAVSINETTFYITQNSKRNNLPWHPQPSPCSNSDSDQQPNSKSIPKALQLHTHPRLALILGIFNADETTQTELDILQGCLGALVTLTPASGLSFLSTTTDSQGTTTPPSHYVSDTFPSEININSDPRFVGCQFLRTLSVIRKDSAFDQKVDWTANPNSEVEKTTFVKGKFTRAEMGWRIGKRLKV